MPSLYYDKTFSIDAAKISPGEHYATSKNRLLVTVLGSCVSACIRDKTLAIGGINHFMLPDHREIESDSDKLARYGTFAMEVLIHNLLALGANKNTLEAKVFGGANVISGLTNNSIGSNNADFVKQYLDNAGIPIIAEDMGGIHPRKVYYFVHTNRVLVRKLEISSAQSITAREAQYQSTLSGELPKGSTNLLDRGIL